MGETAMFRAKVSGSQREKGYILVITAVSAVALMAFVGLAVDTGYLSWVRRREQTAADTAAMAAMLDLKSGATLATAQTDGQSLASLNGFTNGTNNTTVAVNNPPLYGAYAGNSSYVEAIVKQTVPSLFMMVLGQNQTVLAARATARIGGNGSGGGCVYALNSTASRALSLAGSNTITFACSAYSKSSSSSSYYSEGSITLDLANSAKVGVIGSYQMNSGTYIYDTTAKKNVTPVQITTLTDPLASISAPSGISLAKTSATYYDMNSKPPSNTITPGVYCGGLTIGNTGGVTFKMNAGTYVMAGGGFKLQSLAVVDATAGVTVYNTNSTGYGCSQSYSFSPINIDGQATLTMNAPSSGSLAGIAFFKDRNEGASSDQNKIVSQTVKKNNGALYLLNRNQFWI
jgi:Flp pilus assembly protein TadG